MTSSSRGRPPERGSEPLQQLYQEVVLDHCRRPRRRGALANATHHAEGDNPLCGDRVAIDLRVGPSGRIEDVAFTGEGCAISTASASMMADAVAGLAAGEARELAARFRGALTGSAEVEAESLGELAAMLGVRAYPMRVKCATLPWHTLLSALPATTDVGAGEAGAPACSPAGSSAGRPAER